METRLSLDVKLWRRLEIFLILSRQLMRKMLHWGIFGASRDGVDAFPLIQNYPLMTKPDAPVDYLSEAAFSFRSHSFWLSEKPCLPLLKELGPADVGVSLEEESAVNTTKGILIITAAINAYFFKLFYFKKLYLIGSWVCVTWVECQSG